MAQNLGLVSGVVASTDTPKKPDGITEERTLLWRNILDPLLPDQGFTKVYENGEWRLLKGLNDEKWFAVVSGILNTPPVSPVDEEAYIIGVGATGIWVGRDGLLALYRYGQWNYQTPTDKTYCIIDNEQALYKYNGVHPTGNWAITSIGGGVSDPPFDGNRAIKAVPAIGDIPGTATVTEFLETAFYPFLQPTWSIDPLPILEVGVQLSGNLVVRTTPNDASDYTINVQQDTIPIGSVANTPVITVPINPVIATATTFTTFNAGLTSTDTNVDSLPDVTYSPQGVYPVLFGVVPTQIVGNALYTALNKRLVSKSNQTIIANGTGYLYYCFEQGTWDNDRLTEIINDAIGFDQIDSFNVLVQSVSSTGLDANYTQTFIIYESKQVVVYENDSLTFNL